MSHGEALASLLGRCLLGWFFVVEAYGYGTDWSNTVMLLSMKSVSAPEPMLALSLVMIVLGSLSLFLGFHTRAA